RRNLGRYLRGRRQRAGKVEVVCGDASQYVFPDEVTFLFLFNPFNEVVLERVLDRMEESLRRRARDIYVFYWYGTHFSPCARRLSVETIPLTDDHEGFYRVFGGRGG